MRGKPYTPDELAAIDAVVTAPIEFGAIARLARDLGRPYLGLAAKVREVRRRITPRREPRQHGAMLESGESYRNLMKRIHGEG